MSWKASSLVVLSICAAASAGRRGRATWDYDYSIVEGDVQVETSPDRAGGVLGSTPLTSASQLFPVGEAVNYYVASPLSASDARIADAVRDWEAKTCFRFTQCTSTSSCPIPYMYFQSGGGCSSPIGKRAAGVNSITLASACSAGNAMHEIGHSLGLSHEQTRKDRDNYIEVDMSQVSSGLENNFNKNGASARDLGQYDYGSIMHYGANSFRIGSKPTIISPQPIGQRNGLSAGDVAAIEFMYNSCSTRFAAPRCIASQSESTTLVIPVDKAFSVDFNALYTTTRSMRVTYPNTNAPDTQLLTPSGTTITDTGYAALRYTPTRNDAGRTFVLAATFTASDGPVSECRVSVRVEGGVVATASPPTTSTPPVRTPSPPVRTASPPTTASPPLRTASPPRTASPASPPVRTPSPPRTRSPPRTSTPPVRTPSPRTTSSPPARTASPENCEPACEDSEPAKDSQPTFQDSQSPENCEPACEDTSTTHINRDSTKWC